MTEHYQGEVVGYGMSSRRVEQIVDEVTALNPTLRSSSLCLEDRGHTDAASPGLFRLPLLISLSAKAMEYRNAISS